MDTVITTLNDSDKDNVFDLLTDPEVMRFLGPRRALTLAEAEEWFESAQSEKDRFPFRCSKSGELVGFCGMKIIEGKRDFGYFIRKKFWGKGLAKQMCQLALSQLSRRYDLSTFHIFIAENNIASLKVAQSLGWVKQKPYQNDCESGHLYQIVQE
ncbi:GNAT family N-acetyltransferase [Vibrio sp. SCSIO 43132]|uniref:GNAT family N-acetyltransferase n=1 Tax=Vibrio sp. SCSIO 43132 TaxID=2779363 RepID=UPI001CA88DD0|nr:GNAT family N-acetyltransferase [Vibrio sp. SCSIO 43132]UAB73242.1 GNAT family N-acetyltransferase [Vibrio sp. SCSIO 43132]